MSGGPIPRFQARPLQPERVDARDEPAEEQSEPLVLADSCLTVVVFLALLVLVPVGLWLAGA